MTAQPQTRQEKSRQKLAAEKMTPVQNLMRSLQSGQLKSELRTMQEAIHLARSAAMQIGNALKASPFTDDADYAAFKKAAYGEHYNVAIAYMTPDLSMLFTRRYEPGKEAVIQGELSSPGQCCIPVGLLFGIRDPKHGSDWLTGARPFLSTPLVIMALKQRLESEEIGIN